ncbi:MAG: hypothetical protein ACRCZK_01835 [Oscillospiraceae bacterium]
MNIKNKLGFISSNIEEVNLPSLIKLLDIESCTYFFRRNDEVISAAELINGIFINNEAPHSYYKFIAGEEPIDLSNFIATEIYQDDEQNIIIVYKIKGVDEDE